MEFNRKFTDLTQEEVSQIVKDIFVLTKEITGFKRSEDGFYMRLHYEEGSEDLLLRDPWVYEMAAIDAGSAGSHDYLDKLKQFCFAKGICAYAENNPYIKETV